MGKWRRVLSVVLQRERYLVRRLPNRATMLPNLSTSFHRLLATGPAGDRFGTIIAACGYVPEFKYVISGSPVGLHHFEFAPEMKAKRRNSRTDPRCCRHLYRGNVQYIWRKS